MRPKAAPVLLDMRRECIYPKSMLHVLNASKAVTDHVNVEMQQRLED